MEELQLFMQKHPSLYLVAYFCEGHCEVTQQSEYSACIFVPLEGGGFAFFEEKEEGH